MPIRVADLPALNAVLNATTALVLLCGYFCIRRRKIVAHKACMLSAFGLSTLFLVSYLVLRYFTGLTMFPGQGWIRPVYFTILTSHTMLAAAIVPLALVTLSLGLRGRLERHVRIARWTLPIWLYVSATGVLVYWILYRLYPHL